MNDDLDKPIDFSQYNESSEEEKKPEENVHRERIIMSNPQIPNPVTPSIRNDSSPRNVPVPSPQSQPQSDLYPIVVHSLPYALCPPQFYRPPEQAYMEMNNQMMYDRGRMDYGRNNDYNRRQRGRSRGRND